jgi:hypothetical protein
VLILYGHLPNRGENFGKVSHKSMGKLRRARE